MRPFTRMQCLEAEKEYLGLYLSGHPLDDYAEKLERTGAVPLYELSERRDGSMVRTAGMIRGFRKIVSRKGMPMAFVQLEDRVDEVEVVLFPNVWKKYGNMVEKGNLVAVVARVQVEEEGVKLLAERLYPLEQFVPGHADEPNEEEQAGNRKVYVRISANREEQRRLERLRTLLKEHEGHLPVMLYYDSRRRLLALNDAYRVKPSPELIQSIEALFGKGSVRVK